MKQFIINLSGPKKLALAALILGLVAVLLGNPYDKVYTSINTKEFEVNAARGEDKIDVKDLADWIIQGKVDYRLVDLREPDKFNEYSIPTSVNIPVAKLSDSGLMKNQEVILYSEDNVKAAQAWVLLKSQGYKGVYILNGGVDKWKDEVLFPALPADATPQQKTEFDKMAAVSKFFGGSPQTGGTSQSKKEISMPKLKLPAAVPMSTPSNKPKREGC